MKKFLIRFAVFLLTFAIVLVVASRLLNKDHDNLTMEMSHASLPVITMLWEDCEYNSIYGYLSAMDPAWQRDSLTILGENRKTSFKVKTYGRNVTAINAQVRSADGTRLIENLEIQGYEEKKGEILAELALKDLIEKDQEYALAIGLTLDGWQEVWYHTRVIWDEESMVGEELAFVRDFHETLFHREEAKALVKYLESNSKLEDNRSFHKVNIHSSFKQITWGDLKVTQEQEPRFTVKELAGRDASIVVDFLVSTKASDRKSRYRVREAYQIRYSPDRTYLLGYERTMTQIPDEQAVMGGDKLLLGIGDENVDMMENESGSVVAFQQADRLFSYDTGRQELTRIFSFYDAEVSDEREAHDEHDIKILNIDPDGNVDFAVYGYFNRGTWEGKVGIRICRYQISYNTISELAFIPWDKPFSNLKVQMEKLLYLSQGKNLYVCLENSVYCVDLAEETNEKILEITEDAGMQTSADNQILVWQNAKGKSYSNEIHVMDLAEETQVKVCGEANEALKILGFMGQDIIYGVARATQVTRNGAGDLFFPMYKLCIVKADGTLLKEYSQDGIYVTDCSVEENQIILERVKEKEDGSFVEAPQDHVTKTTQKEMGKNQLSVVEIDVYETYVQIQVNGKIDAKKVRLLTPKEVIREGADELVVDATSPVKRYYVYGGTGLDDGYVSVSNAINRADELAGSVIDEEGKLVWRKGERPVRNQIMAIHEPEKTDDSQAACLNMMLRQQGISADCASLLEIGKLPVEILRENLTEAEVLDLSETNLEATLYYVGKDIPVLALLRSGEAVLITGYNESQVVLFQPLSGKLNKKGMTEAAKWFEENGNCFLTFYP